MFRNSIIPKLTIQVILSTFVVMAMGCAFQQAAIGKVDTQKKNPLDSRIRTYCDQGYSFYKAGAFDNAIAEYTAAIDIGWEATTRYGRQVDLSSAYLGRGDVYLAKEDYSKALDDYGKIPVSKYPYTAEALYNRGLALRATGYFEEAAKDFESAIALNPQIIVDTHELQEFIQTQKRISKEAEDARIKQGDSPEDFNYVQNETGTLTITGYRGSNTNVRIPAQIQGIDVTRIGPGAFYGFYKGEDQKLTAVSIPDTVEIIGKEAFAYNRLNAIDISPRLQLIGDWAFSYNLLTTITIDDYIVIRSYAFAANRLTSINLNCKCTIGSYAFAGNRLTSVTLPDDAVIGDFLFSGNPTTSVIISDERPVTIFGDSDVFGNYVIKDTIKKITIGENRNVNGAFETGFVNFYNSQGKKAGTYVKQGQIWVRE
jgi:tetratricopeptide (TPR) repeat protein